MRRQLRTLLCLLVAGVACGDTPDYDIMDGDILVPRARRKADTQGNTFSLKSYMYTSLWPGGRVRYVVAPGDFGLPFPREDARLLAAIREFEEKTCIRFSECADEASCEIPYVRIRGETGYAGSATIGAYPSIVSFVSLGLSCNTFVVIHELGHTVGLGHEHERRDRDEYVRTGLYSNANSKELGPYDCASIMHFPSVSSREIVSPYPIVVKPELSHGDMSAIDFMYNGCSESYTAPTCIASVRVGKTHVIPHSRVWFMVFTAKYATPMSVTHTDDVPGDSVSYSSHVEMPGQAVRHEEVLVTPTAAHAGKTYTISATFTADGVSTTCAVQVRVANSDTMCFGLAASDPGVCSGRGTCTTNPYPCVCHEGYGGADCSGFANCPLNQAFTFDVGMVWSGSSGPAAVTTEFKAAGRGSLQVGRVDPPEQGAAHTDLRQVDQPSRITFHMAAMRGREPMLSFARYESDLDERDCCFFVTRNGEMWSFNDKNTDVEFKPDVFYSVMLDVDWVRQQVTLTVNGEVVGTSSFVNYCSSGIQALGYYGGGWLDEVKLLCTEEEEAQTMCFGLPASDPGVCSGHGKCTTNLVTPCVCDAGYSGLDCRMSSAFTSIAVFTFDQGMGTWVPQFMSGVVTDFSAAGGRSLRVGKVGSHDVGVAHVTLQEASRPRYITLRMAPMAGSVPTFLSFRDAEDRNKDCFYLGRRLDTWSVNGVKEFDFNPGVFHFVELDVDWVGKQVTLTVDRQVVGTSGFHSDCITGMGTMALFGSAWLDEVQMWSVKPSL